MGPSSGPLRSTLEKMTDANIKALRRTWFLTGEVHVVVSTSYESFASGRGWFLSPPWSYMSGDRSERGAASAKTPFHVMLVVFGLCVCKQGLVCGYFVAALDND